MSALISSKKCGEKSTFLQFFRFGGMIEKDKIANVKITNAKITNV